MSLLFEVSVLFGALAPALYFTSTIQDASVMQKLLYSFATSVCCFLVGLIVIPPATHYLLRRHVAGFDLGKKNSKSGADKVAMYVDMISLLLACYDV